MKCADVCLAAAAWRRMNIFSVRVCVFFCLRCAFFACSMGVVDREGGRGMCELLELSADFLVASANSCIILITFQGLL